MSAITAPAPTTTKTVLDVLLAITAPAPTTTKTVLDVLLDGRALYSESPSHVPERECPAEGTYCVITALNHVTEREDGALDQIFWDALRRIEDRIDNLGPIGIAEWNARHSTEEVLEVWDRAIEAAR